MANLILVFDPFQEMGGAEKFHGDPAVTVQEILRRPHNMSVSLLNSKNTT